MNSTIWKSVLKVADVQQIMVPAGSELLCAREQFEQICVWYRCDPNSEKQPRTVTIVGTGNPMPGADGRYLGTASLSGGELMFHVFERQ